MKRFFTSESVTEGHPDKICDQISDAVLDAILAQDPMARVACETCVTTGMVLVMGEITTTAQVDVQSLVRSTVTDIGYTRAKYGFDAETCAILNTIHSQSPDIAMGVDADGAGDQGMVFGYACDETPELMPLPISLAHKLSRRLAAVRKDGTLKYLRPDGKTQVTVEYEDEKPVRVDTIVLSTQHDEEVSQETIRADVIREIIRPIIPADMMDDDTKILVNPTGRFVIGGPMGDSGLTGRKIIVDTYGGYSRHGGGAFSGKDPTKSACSWTPSPPARSAMKRSPRRLPPSATSLRAASSPVWIFAVPSISNLPLTATWAARTSTFPSRSAILPKN